MAIAGLLVHCLSEKLAEVEASVGSMPEMTTYGAREDPYVITVVDAASSEMEKKVEAIEKIDGVLAIYTTFVSFEDELADVSS